MAEKVIFEFRAQRAEEGYQYEVRRGKKRFTVSKPFERECCPPVFVCFGPGIKSQNWSRRIRDDSRRRMRETLDFFEGLYDDLYGEAESSEG